MIPGKIYAHYPTNVFGRPVFVTSTYNSEKDFYIAFEKDFRKSGVSAIKVISNQQKNYNTIVPLMKALDARAEADPTILSPGIVISLANQ